MATNNDTALDSIAEILGQCIQGCNMQIPYYAYGDNQAACEMAGRLNQIHDDLIDVLDIINANGNLTGKQKPEKEVSNV